MMTETIDRAEVERLCGLVGEGEFLQVPEAQQPELLTYLRTIPDMSDEKFMDEAESAIMGEAILGSRGRSSYAYYTKTSAFFHQSRLRLAAAGHEERCGSSLYNRAHARAMRSQGHTPSSPTACNCEELRARA